MKIIIESKEELEQYEDYNSHKEKDVNSIFYGNIVVIDGNLVAGEGECQKYSTVPEEGECQKYSTVPEEGE